MPSPIDENRTNAQGTAAKDEQASTGTVSPDASGSPTSLGSFKPAAATPRTPKVISFPPAAPDASKTSKAIPPSPESAGGGGSAQELRVAPQGAAAVAPAVPPSGVASKDVANTATPPADAVPSPAQASLSTNVASANEKNEKTSKESFEASLTDAQIRTALQFFDRKVQELTRGKQPLAPGYLKLTRAALEAELRLPFDSRQSIRESFVGTPDQHRERLCFGDVAWHLYKPHEERMRRIENRALVQSIEDTLTHVESLRNTKSREEQPVKVGAEGGKAGVATNPGSASKHLGAETSPETQQARKLASHLDELEKRVAELTRTATPLIARSGVASMLFRETDRLLKEAGKLEKEFGGKNVQNRLSDVQEVLYRQLRAPEITSSLQIGLPGLQPVSPLALLQRCPAETQEPLRILFSSAKPSERAGSVQKIQSEFERRKTEKGPLHTFQSPEVYLIMAACVGGAAGIEALSLMKFISTAIAEIVNMPDSRLSSSAEQASRAKAQFQGIRTHMAGVLTGIGTLDALEIYERTAVVKALFEIDRTALRAPLAQGANYQDNGTGIGRGFRALMLVALNEKIIPVREQPSAAQLLGGALTSAGVDVLHPLADLGLQAVAKLAPHTDPKLFRDALSRSIEEGSTMTMGVAKAAIAGLQETGLSQRDLDVLKNAEKVEKLKSAATAAVKAITERQRDLLGETVGSETTGPSSEDTPRAGGRDPAPNSSTPPPAIGSDDSPRDEGSDRGPPRRRGPRPPRDGGRGERGDRPRSAGGPRREDPAVREARELDELVRRIRPPEPSPGLDREI